MIKTGGANVSPVEVDEVLAKIPEIKRSQTVGIPHDTLGEVVVACIVLHAGGSLNERALQEILRDELASFKIPRAVLFIEEKDFIVTGSDKVKTSALRELAIQRLVGRTINA
jgi:acyl-CoA synthetase (AMP-forming)/AMP-acid ligase II